MKFITIVVCAYNESLNIYNCLKSLATIDYPANKFEVIIIDDDSEDETLDIIKKFILENKHINFLRIISNQTLLRILILRRIDYCKLVNI